MNIKDFQVLKSIILAIFLTIAVVILTGCGATHTAINKRKLDVQTKMSATIFLDPVTTEKRRMYVQVRNTSDKPELDLQQAVAVALIDKGYTLVHNPEQAHYILQANILQVGRSDLRAAEHALSQGFGAAIGGAAVGAAIGSLGNTGHKHHRQSDRMVVGGLIGAAVSTVTDAMVQDVVYSVIADVQISERVASSISVKEKTKSKLKQGTSGTKEITSTEKTDWKRYQTRIVGTANKVNLKFEQAAPELIQGLTRSIAGVF